MVSARCGELEACFRNLTMSSGGGRGEAEIGGDMPTLSGWKDLPMELLMRIISAVGDDRIVVVASGVCTGWRDALGWGVTNLSLSWCQQNMNNLTISFAHKFTKLQVLTLRQIKPQLEDSAVEAVANYCYDLRELDLSRSFRLTDRSLYALANGCPRLTKLNISGCSSFSDSALIYLSCHCKNLKCLNLCGCVKAATDGSLQAIARNCGHLQSLNLGWCDNITDDGVTSLASGCPDLRALDLCGCVLITDECYCSCKWVPAPAIFGPVLLPEHHRSCHVLPRKQLREEQSREVGYGEEQRLKGRRRAGKPQHQPMHGIDTSSCSGGLRLLPIAPHLSREALPHHQRLPQPDVCSLCLWPPAAPCRRHPAAHEPCVLSMCVRALVLVNTVCLVRKVGP